MAATEYTCPECKAKLKVGQPLPPGKAVKCPKCSAGFKIPAAEPKAAARKPAPVPAKTAPKPKAPVPPKPAPKPKAPVDEDEEEGGSYSIMKPGEGEDDAEFVSPIPPERPVRMSVVAAGIVQTPARLLLGAGVLGCVIGLGGILYFVFPMVFSEHLLEIKDVLKDAQGKPLDKKWAELDDNQQAEFMTQEKPEIKKHILGIVGCVVVIAYFAVVSAGAVKMLLLESHTLGMVACIMGCITLVGIMGLMALLREEVKEGFEEEKNKTEK